jgi:hypothetical protein
MPDEADHVAVRWVGLPIHRRRDYLSHLFSKENQVQTYMHARISFHAYS